MSEEKTSPVIVERTPIKRLGGYRPGRNVAHIIRIPKRCEEEIKELLQESNKTNSEVICERIIKGLRKEP